jgi:hypothetical protein
MVCSDLIVEGSESYGDLTAAGCGGDCHLAGWKADRDGSWHQVEAENKGVDFSPENPLFPADRTARPLHGYDTLVHEYADTHHQEAQQDMDQAGGSRSHQLAEIHILSGADEPPPVEHGTQERYSPPCYEDQLNNELELSIQHASAAPFFCIFESNEPQPYGPSHQPSY